VAPRFVHPPKLEIGSALAFASRLDANSSRQARARHCTRRFGGV